MFRLCGKEIFLRRRKEQKKKQGKRKGSLVPKYLQRIVLHICTVRRAGGNHGCRKKKRNARDIIRARHVVVAAVVVRPPTLYENQGFLEGAEENKQREG